MAENPNAGHRKRLKERFKRASLEGFHDYEAVELLLTFAIPRRDVKPVAKELIRRFGGIKGLFEATAEELSEVSGIGSSAAVLILFVRQAAEAYIDTACEPRPVINRPFDVARLLPPLPGGMDGRLLALYLNTKNEVLVIETVSEGEGEPGPAVSKTVIEAALRHNARSLILARQSAASNRVCETQERRVVNELARAGATMEIILHDYIVVAGAGEPLSAKKEGWLG